ncbi:MAG: hypothetical protein M4579_003868 [Chaenotheca gracillima]|nr:MAG: hypothetical protein M4579_003868 [Chaenotheca gracillima]
MADPVSLVLGVLAYTMQAVHSSKALLELVADIRGAPGTIRTIYKEVYAFYEVVNSLTVLLKDEDVQNTISGNTTLIGTVQGLIKPIKNCRATLGQLGAKLEKLRDSCLETPNVRSSFVGVKWSLFSKNEISKLQQILETEKLTISVALNVINLMTSMRVLTLAEETRVVSEARVRGLSSTSTVMSPFTPFTSGTPTLQLATQRPCDHTDLEKTVDDMEATYISMNQISESLKAIVQTTQHAVMSTDSSLHQKVGQVYQDLSKAGIQIQRIKSSTAHLKEFRRRKTVASSNESTRTSKFEDLDSRRNDLEESDSAVIEVFFDCVSRFSTRDPHQSIDDLQVSFFGSPEYRFELLPSFYPEQYVSGGSISKEVFAVAMLPSKDNQLTSRYFLSYAETARRWQRVVVCATFHGERQQTDTLRVAPSDNHLWGAPKTLPSAVHSLLRKLLPSIEFYSSITQISLDLHVGEKGQITAESPRVEVIEDESEMSKSAERDFLQYIDSVCCEQHVESDVVTSSRIGAASYRVYVDSRACVENKVMFASGKKQGNNAFLDYLDTIKHHISLRRCVSVSEFRGVVLDDTKRHLRSYLQEQPMVTSLEILLSVAVSRSKIIPILVRILWARQLVQAIIEIHSQGLVAGAFNLNSVGIKADGTAVFHRLQCSGKSIHDASGMAPPELRAGHQNDGSSSAVRNKLTFQTDVFQLGLLLWLLMEHVPKDVGYFCAKAACTQIPSICMETHANPVELPKCRENVPAYLCDIIRDCRLPDPQSRVSTNELAHVLCSTPQPDITPAEVQQALMPYIGLPNVFQTAIYCDICRDVTTDLQYHCNLCKSGDYDLCPACFEKGGYCLVPEHQLVKRARGQHDFIDISR